MESPGRGVIGGTRLRPLSEPGGRGEEGERGGLLCGVTGPPLGLRGAAAAAGENGKGEVDGALGGQWHCHLCSDPPPSSAAQINTG